MIYIHGHWTTFQGSVSVPIGTWAPQPFECDFKDLFYILFTGLKIHPQATSTNYHQLPPHSSFKSDFKSHSLLSHRQTIKAIEVTPTNNNNNKRKRSWSRAVFSSLQRKGLEMVFERQKYITKPDRKKLAARLLLTDAQVFICCPVIQNLKIIK